MKPSLLKVERKLREWSQAKVAEAVGVTAKTVSRWEQGLAIPHPYYRNKLSTLFGKTAEELGLEEAVVDEDDEIQQLPSPFDQTLALDISEQVLLHEMIADYVRTQSEALAVRQQMTDSLISDVKSPSCPVDQVEQALSTYQSLWEVGTSHIRSKVIFRSSNRSSWYPLLTGLITLIVGLAIITVTLIFNRPLPQESVHATTNQVPMTQPISSTTTISGTTYEAAATGNKLSGGAIVASCSTCRGGKQVGDLGHTATLRINNIQARTAGMYTLTIYYLYGNVGSHRNLHITVNNVKPIIITVAAMKNWNEIGTLTTAIYLNAGNNTIEFSNPWGVTPNIDRIVISPS